MALQQRIERLMKEFGWAERDVAGIAGVTPSAVAQWLGKGSKTIHEIGNLKAALNLSLASGYSPLWIAKGIPPERTQEWAASRPQSIEGCIEFLGSFLEALPPDVRQAAGGQLQTLVSVPRMWPSVARTLTELAAGDSQERFASSG